MDFMLRLRLPYYTWTITKNYNDEFDDIPFNSEVFSLKVENANQEGGFMDIVVVWKSTGPFVPGQDNINRAVDKGVAFINHIIYYARTFDVEAPDFVLVSPRTIKNVSLHITDEGNVVHASEEKLVYDQPVHFREYFNYLNEPGSFDTFSEIIKEGMEPLLEINLLVDAYHAIYEGRFNEAIINCMTAVEAHISPKLTKWLQDKFINKSEKNAENVLLEIPSSSKYEMFFGTVAADYLKTELGLLENLKSNNRLRNEIIHKGKRATKKEAVQTLNTVSKLLMISFFKIEPDS